MRERISTKQVLRPLAEKSALELWEKIAMRLTKDEWFFLAAGVRQVQVKA